MVLDSQATPALAGSPEGHGGRRLYKVGTLTYTTMGLVGVFFWLLWGDFCFTLMESVFPKLLPPQLKGLGASNLMMSLLTGSIPGVLNMVITPVVSYHSDRYRGRWGRRIPYLFWPTPFIALFLILLGFAPEIGAFLYRSVFAHLGRSSSTAVILGVMAVLVVAFQFFNMFVASVYYYLFNDVVPEQFLGRFMALFRVVSSAAGTVFMMFIFGRAEHHMRAVFVGAALLYLVGFLLMCWKVREGEYPPPPEQVEGPGLISAFKTYFKECFSHRYYLYFFLGTSLWSMSGAVNIFNFFFCQSLGMNWDQYGKLVGYLSIPTIILLYPAGILADRYNPLRVTLAATAILVPLNLAGFLFIHSYWSYVAVSVIVLPVTVAYGAANLPMYMALLPKERYGQFCSAQAMINAMAMIAANFAAGYFMDLMKRLHGGSEDYYRYLYIWAVVFQALSLAFMLLVYRGWLRYGGMKSYTPPAVDAAATA